MDTPYIIITILSVVILILLYGVYNSIKKIEKYEDLLQDQLIYLKSIDALLKASDKKLSELDLKQTFEADDEVGEFFKNLKQIQELINEYTLPENYGETKK